MPDHYTYPMAKIESKQVTVSADSAAISAYLADMNNFHHLLPQDKISDWKADEKNCSFKVQGGYTIQLEHAGQTGNIIHMKSGAASPFPFTLDVHLKPGQGVTVAHQVIDAEVNPFMKMMIEKPLKNLFDYIADKLVAQF